ncbi:deoxyguanosinetriphosphate triphosphohydrolase [Candidatus Pelagibacter sp. IMCC9063]|jgi:dGTPase|uniref:deoxyguanosinetriphosphate triphosphohydrolase n=1 Tax=Pelagibacter sp. (strain IMCC9063) TaxID=1002672 RepID=UPI000204680B|nr:deoxyguanosinetriphosphate triphosphohydrolase [Candidatus Pelagibacter sp. IMCC9063]AEA81569.1 deoxyguanosinetriphosphate triphosphohydrolase [Candidatus Pelagibacter sp. IMCC9063]|tara:strand:+ start:1770 stop:2903 length:1134 start_codon:yes stop_codon:yes gene_type:complete
MNRSTENYNSILKPYASNKANFLGRLYPETTSAYRSEYQRDRDRVIHCSSFRRLKHKTQVFVYHEGDHFRTRLTHSLEVSQISRSIARYMGLNEDLCEALSLAHDLGHTPFGHAGEDVLSECMSSYGGFDHNIQSLRILLLLENIYEKFPGLNLSTNTVDGLLKHNGPIIDENKVLSLLPDIKNYKINFQTFGSLEAQISSLSDDIAYNNHDIDDGLRANFFTIDDLKEIPILKDIILETYDKNSTKNNYKLVRRLIDYMVTDLINNSIEQINLNNISSIEKVHKASKEIIIFSEKTNNLIKNIKSFLFNNMYKHAHIQKWSEESKIILNTIFIYYMKNYNKIEKNFNNSNSKERNISDYISGMTDKYAIDLYSSIK